MPFRTLDDIIPKNLTLRRGIVGRVGVLGGALECVFTFLHSYSLFSNIDRDCTFIDFMLYSYTGAPFFAAISAMKVVRPFSSSPFPSIDPLTSHVSHIHIY